MAIDESALVAPAKLGIAVHDLPGLTVMKLFGELDLSSAETLREALLTLDLEAAQNVEMDLRALTFLESIGIGVIVSACKRIRASGDTFSASCNHNLARRSLEVAGLVDFLELHDGEASHPNQRGKSRPG
jgi:anti-sigma B factor antagonist